MLSISTCPHCYGTILVGSLTDPAQRLRCPLCSEVFTVEQVATGSAAAPPLAEPVEPEPAEVAPPEAPPEAAAAAAEAGSLATAEPSVVESAAEGIVGDETLAAAGSIAQDVESAADTAATFPAGEPTGQPQAIAETEPSGEAPDAEMVASEPDTVERLGEPPAEDAARREDTTAETPVEEPAVEGATEGEADEETENEPAEEFIETYASPYVSQTARARRATGVPLSTIVFQLIGVVGGGFMGLALGYLILMWILGPPGDFLRIRHKLPSFLVPSDSRGQRPWWPADASFADTTQIDPSPTSSGVRLASHVAAGPPAVEPLAVAPVMQPRSFTPASLAQLAQLLSDTEGMLGCELCDSTGYVKQAAASSTDPRGRPNDQRVRCPRCLGRSSARLTPEVYQQLCRLAEAATFVRVEPDDATLAECRMAVQDVALRAAGNRQRSEAIGRLAAQRLSASTRQGHGIILAGTVQEAVAEPFGHRISIVLFGTPRLVEVYSQRGPQGELARGDRVVILGSIVDSPAVNLTGYLGTLGQVVWGGLAVRLVEPQ